MKRIVIVIFLSISLSVWAQPYVVTSPDGNLVLSLNIGTDIKYTVSHNGTELITPSAIALTVNGGQVLGANPVVLNTGTRSVNNTITPLYGKNKTLAEAFNELTIIFDANYSLILRAYNEGVAYRFVTSLAGEITVDAETATFNLAGTPGVFFPEADASMHSWERSYYRYNSINQIAVNRFAVTPTMFSYPTEGLRVVIAESDLFDYPGMYVQRTSQGMVGKWAAYPKTVSEPDNIYAYHRVLTREVYIAKTQGAREFPWRVVIVSDDDKNLLTNQLIYKLARPSVLTNTDYIVPGKSVWEWWHDAILETTSIPSGLSNLSYDLYKYYVDFAAQYKIEYITLDAGWSTSYVAQLCQYAASKNVKVFLWDFINLPVENPNRLAQLKALGAAGVKVDLIERDDQVANNWVEQIAQQCADLGLMVIFHGVGKPTGLERTYPNIINFEAVRGAECLKWDQSANPDYHLEFPFIRMLAGPIDYTPGSMRNVHVSQFWPTPTGIPMSMGTRAHELAMYILYDQPLGYLCDSPTEYRKFPEVMGFLSKVPTSWDETIPLAAEVGEYAVLAKRKGEEWYVAAMTNTKARNVEIDFSFLPEGDFFAEVLRDNEFSDVNAKIMTREVIVLNQDTKRTFSLTKSGGATLRINSLVTGVEKEKPSHFSVFTNPSRTQLIVQSENNLDTIYIVDMAGRVHDVAYAYINQQEVCMDISILPNGQVYVVYAKDTKGQHVAKFIK